MAGLRGAGKVYLNVYRDNAWTGYLDMSNIAAFTIGNSGADKVTLKSTAPANYGTVIGSSTTPGDDTISITLNDPNRKNLATMLLGTDADLSNTGGSVSAEVVPVIATNTVVALAKRRVATSPTPVVKNAAETTTYTVNTDYTIDYDNGLLIIPEGSTIVAGDLHVAYTHSTYSGYTITARTQTSIVCKMLFTGKNLDSGDLIRVMADDIELSPEGDFSLISADNAFLEFQLSGTIKVPDGETTPFDVEVIEAA